MYNVQMGILEEASSIYNKNIKVLRTLAFGTYIQVDGLTQSGGILNSIWKEVLKKLSDRKFQSCLILGLGGGSVAKIVSKNYPDMEITGVDIDEKMVELGKKYLGLNKIDINIKIADANKF